MDSVRGENLVLRSRTVQSPSYSTSTPSHSRKRGVRERGQLSSPHAKRTRTGLDGADDGEDVNSGSTDAAQNEAINVRDAVDSATNESYVAAGQEIHEGTHPNAEANSTPTVSSATKVEIFTTPATSKHRRFDSEEPYEETVVVNQSTDSSTHNGYHTADEEVEGSDDAPEIESTKTPSVGLQRRSIRAPGLRKRARISTKPHALPAEKSPAGPQSVVERAAISARPFTQTTPHSVINPEVQDTNLDTVPAVLNHDLDAIVVNNDAGLKPADVPGSAEFTREQSMDGSETKINGQPTELFENTTPPSGSRISSEVQLPTGSSPTTSTPPVELQKRTVFTSIDTPNVLPLSKPSKTQLSRNKAPAPFVSKLPNRGRKTFEAFRRNQLIQRLALQRTWPKKRSAFGVS